ncbi:MAG: biopolymer transporter ExbD [Gammaproteobacteria bacterium]|nr:biopolymer transporter ExbD [Gammaproteobacteria bacterium]
MKSRTRRSDAIGIEIAPLIDIVFILLIFFVVTSTFIRENALEIDLPASHSSIDPDTRDAIEIVISADNEIRVADKLIPTATVNALKAELEVIASKLDSGNVIVRADATAHHATVVHVLDAASLLGLTEISIVTVEAND